MSSSGDFQKEYKKLNPAQKQAVDSIEGPVMVVAGPGTGKTQVLTLRIANILLKTDVNPGNILALTFTDSGVTAMRKRLVSLIGSDGYKVEITTFHSFCNEVIRRYPEDFNRLISSTNILEVEQIQLLEDILNTTSLEVLKPFGDPLYHLRNILAGINDLKKEGVTPEAFLDAIKNQTIDFQKIDDLYHQKGAFKDQMKGKYQDAEKNIKKLDELLILYNKYQEVLTKKKLYDFNDMLLEVILQLAKNPGLLLRLQEQYQYILIDEHQDTNTAQNKLMEILSSFHPEPNLFVVGDANQAIYRFQGASLENFLFFKKLYPSAKLISLSDNYRSTQAILNAAGNLISKNLTADLSEMDTKLVASGQSKGRRVQVAVLSDYHSELFFLAEDIAKKIKSGVAPNEIAVLARNNRDILPLAGVFEQTGVPFNIESDQNIFTDPQIRKLILLFQAVEKFGEDPELISLMHGDFLNLNYLDLYHLIRLAKINRTNLYEILSSQKLLKEVGLVSPESFTRLIKQIESWKKISHNYNLETLVVRVLQESGLLNFILRRPNCKEILDKLTGLYEDIKLQTEKNPDFSLSDYLNYLELLKSHDILIKRPPQTVLPEAVRLMTAHRAKGLEFDFVYIINAYDSHWGNMRRRPSGIKLPWEYLGVKLKLGVELEENDDERRLFYVALTRAKQGVIISYSTRSLEGKEQVGSQFLTEIADKFKETVGIEKFKKQFLANKQQLFAVAPTVKSNLKDKQFFKQVFLERGLSATALNNYLDCPWKFFYRNLLSIPEEKNDYLIFGSAIHKAINTYIKAVKAGLGSQEILLQGFKTALDKETSSSHISYGSFLKRGDKILKDLYNSRAKNWPAAFQTETFVAGVKLTPEIKLSGMIDVIEPLKNGQIRVFDFKTGRPKTRTEIEGSYLRQLIFYKILLDLYSNGRMKMVEGFVEFVELDPRGKYHQEVFQITEEEVKDLIEKIKYVAKEIMDLAFWDRRCDNKECQYCGMRNLM